MSLGVVGFRALVVCCCAMAGTFVILELFLPQRIRPTNLPVAAFFAKAGRIWSFAY